jgi:hypothetical protein
VLYTPVIPALRRLRQDHKFEAQPGLYTKTWSQKEPKITCHCIDLAMLSPLWVNRLTHLFLALIFSSMTEYQETKPKSATLGAFDLCHFSLVLSLCHVKKKERKKKKKTVHSGKLSASDG